MPQFPTFPLPTLVARAALALALVSSFAACSDGGRSAAPPADVTVTPGDGRVTMQWRGEPGVEYWVFGAANAAVTTRDWSRLERPVVSVRATAPEALCGLVNDIGYWFTVNGRTSGGPGGEGSPAVGGTPRVAGRTWQAGAFAGRELFGGGFAVTATCRNAPSRIGKGVFILVGDAGSVFTSDDGVNWVDRTPPGVSARMYAATGFALNVNIPENLQLRLITVGQNGASLVSTDGVNFSVGRAPDPSRATMRAMANVRDQHVAVGDGGAIETTPDGVNWAPRASGTTANIGGIVYGEGRFVAVTDAGQVLFSGSGETWGLVNVPGAPAWRAVAFGNFDSNSGNNEVLNIRTYVAVGDGGVFGYSTNGGDSWTTGTIPGAGNLIGVSYSTAFVAVDSNGAAFVSRNGANWSALGNTGMAPTRSMFGSSYGFIAAGASGRYASAF